MPSCIFIINLPIPSIITNNMSTKTKESQLRCSKLHCKKVLPPGYSLKQCEGCLDSARRGRKRKRDKKNDQEALLPPKTSVPPHIPRVEGESEDLDSDDSDPLVSLFTF